MPVALVLLGPLGMQLGPHLSGLSSSRLVWAASRGGPLHILVPCVRAGQQAQPLL